MLNNESNPTLKLSSKILCAPSFPRLIHTKLSRYFLHYMMPFLKNDPEAEVQLDIESIRDTLNYRANGRLQQAIQDLEKLSIDWDAIVNSSVKWGSTYLFERCELDFRGVVHIKVNPQLVGEILAPHSYKLLELNTLLKFQSHYALRLFEYSSYYFMKKENYGRSPNLLLDKLRLLVGCEGDEYPRTYDFIKNAIILPLKEVAAQTPLRVYLRHDKRHIYSRRYWLEICNVDLPGDPIDEAHKDSTPAAEYAYLVQRLATFATKYGNVPRALFDQTIKALDYAVRANAPQD